MFSTQKKVIFSMPFVYEHECYLKSLFYNPLDYDNDVHLLYNGGNPSQNIVET